jgi:hypothetical protein
VFDVGSHAAKKLYGICYETQYVYDNTNATARLHATSLGVGVEDFHLGHVLSRKCDGFSITIKSSQAGVGGLQQASQAYTRTTANIQDATCARFLVNDMPIAKMGVRRWSRQAWIAPLSAEFDLNYRSRTEVRYVLAPLSALNVGRFLRASAPQLTAAPTAAHG